MKEYITETYYKPIQLKMPMDMERMIEISDPVYSFNEVMDHIDLNQYFEDAKEFKAGRHRYDSETLLKIVLFAFMEFGYPSLRRIEKLCKTDIRFMWLLGDKKAPSFMTVCNFINRTLKERLEDIVTEINQHIFRRAGVDQTHIYIDGTKIEANANRYTWVWKKSCLKNRQKVYERLTALLEEINTGVPAAQGVKFGTRDEYEIEYVEMIMAHFLSLTGLTRKEFVHGSGRRKSLEQKQYEKLEEYCERLKKYALQIAVCGEKRNSYSKTDPGATFMRIKKDYMGNDQLLPAYNVQIGVCDEYIAVVNVEQYASDMDCFVPLMEKFNRIYGFYPQYPIADAGYGSYNNYLYCEEHGMEKFMKFPMYEKESKEATYRDNPFRAANFSRNAEGALVCPNGKKFLFQRRQPVRGNRYERMEEVYQCEDCTGCSFREKCYKGKANRTIRLNEELTSIHKEVLDNLNCVHGALLRMNRSIQAEGAFGGIKWNRLYRRARRRGISRLILELTLISCGFNLHKYDLKRRSALLAA